MKNSALRNVNFKKVVITLFCLLLGLTASSLFVFVQNGNQAKSVSAVSVETELPPAEEREYVLSFDAKNNDGDISASDLNGTYCKWKNVSGNWTAQGGTSLTIKQSSTDGYIYVTLGGTSAYVVPDPGYKFASLTLLPANITWTTSTGEKSYSVETLDPTYKGTISITAVMQEIQYDLDGFFEDGSGEWNKVTGGTYSISESFDMDDLSPTSAASNKQHVGWLLNYSNMPEEGRSVDGAEAKYEATGIDVTFYLDSSTSFTGADGNTYYGLDSVQGYGDFSIAGLNSYTTPWIIARYEVTYNFVVNNGDTECSYWKGLDVSDVELRGVGTTNSDRGVSARFTSTKVGNHIIPSSEYDSNYLAFMKGEETYSNKHSNWPCYVYNYGHYLTGWNVTTTLGGVKLGYVSTGWTTSNPDYYDEDLLNYNINTMLARLDSLMAGQLGRPEITMKPQWGAATIYTDEHATESVTFGTTYSISDRPVEEGQTLFAYTYDDEAYIAKSGVWNYKEIPYDKIPGSTASEYGIILTPVGLDNVYKMTLKNALTNESGAYELENNDFTYHTQANDKTATSFVYNDIKSFTTYSATSYPLIDNYITYLKSYKTGYEEEIDGDNNGDDPIFHKVFYSAGTVDGSSLTVSNPTLWIYMANNQKTGKLPMFKTRYQITAFWICGALKYGTREYSEFDLSKEKSTINFSDIWLYSNASVKELNAWYVNKIDLYYENRSENYEYVISKHFSNDLDDLLISDTKPNKNNYDSKFDFYNWMFDAAKAKTTYGYTISGTIAANQWITVKNNSLTTQFYITRINQNNGDIYYINKVKGDYFVQNDNNPIITMGAYHLYDFIVDNSGDYTTNYWASLNSTKNDLSLFGAASGASSTTPSNNFTTTLKVVNAAGYNYPFMLSYMNNEGLSFYHGADMKEALAAKNDDGNWYYVYNYGHYIKGWQISFEFSSTNASKNGVVLYMSNLFVAENALSTDYYAVDNNTSNYSFRHIAEAIDLYLDGFYIDEIPSVIVAPVWEKTTINVVGKDTENGSAEKTLATSIKFEEEYILANAQMTLPAGKSLFAYSYGGDADLIATNDVNSNKDGIWNYRNINKNKFSYNSAYLGNGIYTIDLNPLFIDNIYKVKLNNVVARNLVSYQLSKNSFERSTDSMVGMLNFDDYSVIDKNGYEFKYYYETTSINLIDDYIAQLNGYKIAYRNGIDGNGHSDFTIFNKVYATTGTISQTDYENDTVNFLGNISFFVYFANEQSIAEAPAFVHDLSMQIDWENVNGRYAYATEYYDEDLYGAELRDTTDTFDYTPDDAWEYAHGGSTDNFAIKARYVYSVRLYYSTDATTSINTVHDSVNLNEIGYFGRYTSFDLLNDDNSFKIEPKASPKDKAFERWMLDISKVSANGYSWTKDDANKILTVSKDGINIKFKYSGVNFYNSNLFYIIGFESGYGLFEQTNTNPIITAKWTNLFDLTIDNSNTYWKDLDQHNSTLYGAYSTVTHDAESEPSEFYKTSFKISNNDQYQYAFMTSEVSKDGNDVGVSFYHLSDWEADASIHTQATDGSYYLFNYGHYVSAYILKIEIGSQTHYFVKTNQTWGAMTTSIYEVSLTNLIGSNATDFKDFARQADEFAASYLDRATLTLYPVWEETTVQVDVDADYAFNNADLTLQTIKYTDLYNLNNNKTSLPIGKSIMSYSDSTGAMIATDTPSIHGNAGRWNYRNIPAKEFHTYNAGSVVGNGTYVITVTPNYVDNIYQVNLNNVKILSTDLYKIIDSDFEFNSSTGTYRGTSQIELNFDEKIDSKYNFKRYNNEALMDTYIEDLVQYQADYISGITHGSANHFEIFKKVYYSVGNASTDENQNDTLISSSAPTFHIYLANEQQTGNLPVFEKNYYTLIFWKNIAHIDGSSCPGDCGDNSKHYAYATKAYDKDVHQQEIIEFECHVDEKGEFNNLWTYADGYNRSNNTVTIEAVYFRKNYKVEISTLNTENDLIERRGYVRFTATDKVYEIDTTVEDCSFDYIIIFDGTEMMVYRYVAGSIIHNTNFVNGLRVSEIRLYEGCDVEMNIYDQSKDATAMQTGYFDDMIGYKYSQSIIQKLNDLNVVGKELFDGPNRDNAYKFFVDAEGVRSREYQNKDIIQIFAEYERIVYDITFKIDNYMAGSLSVATNGLQSEYKTTLQKNDVAVQNMYLLDYYAEAGFKLENNAFLINNGRSEKTLQIYDETNGNIAEEYVLTKYDENALYVTPNDLDNTLNGTWLRLFFYADYTDYSVTNLELGTLWIMTCPIEFVLGVKVYDESDEAFVDAGHIIETTNRFDVNISLDEVTGKGLTPEVHTYLLNENYEFYYYISESNIDYALLSTRMYFTNDYTTKIDNFYTTYSFLLTTKPTNKYALTSTQLARMVNYHEEGKIIHVTDRNIFIMLEVRKILTVDMTVAQLGYDSNSSIRTTTLENADNNRKTITIEPNATSETVLTYSTSPVLGYYVSTTGKTTLRAYSYYGLTNTLTSTFDLARYSNVEYSINGGTPLSGNTFETTENTDVLIKFIPQSLKVEIVYSLDGAVVTTSEIAPYLIDDNAYKPQSHYVYRAGDYVTYFVECINPDYNVSVKINSTNMGSTNLTNRTVQCIKANDDSFDNRYLVTNNDFAVGKITINVNAKMMDKAIISVRYQLKDNSKACADDVFGTFNLYENSTIKNENVEFAETPIIKGRDVYVRLNLAAGYQYDSILVLGIRKFVDVNADGLIKLVGDFDPDANSGEYYVIIDKTPLTAILNTTNVNPKSQYLMMNATNPDGWRADLHNLYVGSTINFKSNPTQEERLDYFYYIDKDGNKVQIVSDLKQEYIPFKITSEVLEKANKTIIDFGVEVVKRFKLDFSLNGEEYLKEEGFKLIFKDSEQDYVSGTYVDEGTEILLIAEPLVIDKYTIQLIETPEVIATEWFNCINKGDVTFKLSQNHVCELTIAPKEFSVNVEENLYTTLLAVRDKAPDTSVASADQVNDIQAMGQTYNSQARIQFIRKTADRELATVYIANNDNDDLKIEFVNGYYNVFKILQDGTTEAVDLINYGFTIEITEHHVILNYVTYNNVDIRFDYKLYKIIQA